MPGRGTVDAVFVLRRLIEKFRAKNKKLLFVFVDLEKAFDRVLKEAICCCISSRATIKFISCESWCPLRVYFEPTFVYHGNGCFDRTCQGWVVNAVVVCR